MATASRSSRTGFAFRVLLTGLCLWLGYSVVSTGLAGRYETLGDGNQALRWRAGSPEGMALEATRLVRDDEHAAADAMARRTLMRSTLRADALRTLALSASARGRAEEALTLMSQASQINPRDETTRNWLFGRAIGRDDYQSIVLQADYLMRLSPEIASPLSFQLIALLGNGAFRARLVQRLSLGPPWRGTFLSIAARYGGYDEVAALFQALKSTPTPVTDAEATPFFMRLVGDAKYRQAKDYFDALVPRPDWKEGLVYDGEIGGRPGPPPLNWQAIKSAGGSAGWTMEDGTALGSLQVSHDGFSSSSPLVRQLILLPPGYYEVSARARVDDPVAVGRFKIQVNCAGGSRLISMPLRGAPGSWQLSRAGFIVPPEACEAQWLLITPVTGDRREMAEMLIDDIIVRPARIGSIPRQEPDWTP